MKILMLNYEFPPIGGGASPVSFEYAKELVKAGHKVDVVTMGYKNLPKFEVKDGVNIYRVPCLRRRAEVCQTYEMFTYILSALPKVLSLYKKNNYDINHTHFLIPTGLLSWWVKSLTGLPVVITSHGSDVPGYNPDRFTFQHKIVRPFWLQVLKSADFIVSPSKHLRNLIYRSASLPESKVKVIPHGFDYGNYPYSTDKKQQILTMTRMLPRKGVQYFLRALHDIDLDNYVVKIAGDGPYLSELRKMAEKWELDVDFLGWVEHGSDDFMRLYEESSIFVFPSTQESFGVVLQEAMASGMAIITTNISGCPEAVGDAGLLVPPKDSQAIKRELSELIQDNEKRRMLMKKARKRVKEKFDWSSIVRKYESLYARLVDTKDKN